jgi:hypothetical protein
MKIQLHRLLKKSFLWIDDKYETVTVDSGYKIYMKLHVRNISRTDFMEYRSEACHACTLKNTKNHAHTVKNMVKPKEVIKRNSDERKVQNTSSAQSVKIVKQINLSSKALFIIFFIVFLVF